jgi:RNA-directed DNA polymerase
MGGRPPVKGNAPQPPLPWTQSQEDGRPAALERLRQAVRRKRQDRLTSLYHHIYQVAHLREAYLALQRQAAPGVAGVTWQHYGQDLEANLQDLSERLARGAYRATAVRRAYIPKPDGRQRPLGMPVLEDTIVQWVTAWILSVIWDRGYAGAMREQRAPVQPSRRRELSAHAGVALSHRLALGSHLDPWRRVGCSPGPWGACPCDATVAG